MHWNTDGHRLVLRWGDSYMVDDDDGFSVQTFSDMTNTSHATKAKACKVALVELLLRAPHRRVVRILSEPFQRGEHPHMHGSTTIDMIWDLAHH